MLNAYVKSAPVLHRVCGGTLATYASFLCLRVVYNRRVAVVSPVAVVHIYRLVLTSAAFACSLFVLSQQTSTSDLGPRGSDV